MIASTNDAYCPTLRAVTTTALARRGQLGPRDRGQRHDAAVIAPAMRLASMPPARGRVDQRRQLWRQARTASFPSAGDHVRDGRVSGGLEARLRAPLRQRAELRKTWRQAGPRCRRVSLADVRSTSSKMALSPWATCSISLDSREKPSASAEGSSWWIDWAPG